MKRSRTVISVWPAIADLMTVVALFAIIVTMSQCAARSSQTGPEEKTREELQASLTDADNTIRALRDSLAAERFGTVPCSGLKPDGQPKSIVTIRVLPRNRYQVVPVWSTDERSTLGTAAAILGNRRSANLSAAEFRRFGSTMVRSATSMGRGDCSFWAQIESRDVTKTELQLRWMNEVSGYFNAVNPGALR